MSEMSEKARADGKDKVKRLTESKKGSVDASGWTEDEYGSGMMETQKKLGNRPISKQNLATGGRAALKHGGRRGRDMGGGMPMSQAGSQYVAQVPAPPQNRFSFTGNQSPFLAAAGMAKGGKANPSPEVEGNRPKGGRMARKDGGSAGKGKMSVNIIIAQKPDHQMMPGGAPTGAMPPKPPMQMPPTGGMPPPPPGAGPNMPPPSMGGGAPPPPMGRKDGGKVYPDMEFSAANGKGRLEKAKKYG